MELRDAIYGRCATHNFLQTAVTRTAITSLIDAAVQAPNAMNDAGGRDGHSAVAYYLLLETLG